ncbi:hypothetical protein [Sphingomonas baiyangensis]|uniref:Tetratricopeptide repeat protein n=1 Tax=Sphingomonas baiyangensis TaxID=2572576 RepID=A0A4U1L445_9SPHN|nr:hypothetical protein [Sphingomonas baiyangensis]TKD51020.1 hypothetical protein FBR43_09820 [Sphingomonas baiyangensis]
MSIVSKAALAAMLTLGGLAAVVATPAEAQRKKKGENAQPQLEVGEEFRKSAVAAQTALQAKDYATAEQQLAAAEALIKNDDERYFAASLRLPIEAQKQNNAGIKQALEVMLPSPRLNPADAGRLNFVRGNIALNEKDTAGALQYLARAQELGYQSEDLPLMVARAQMDSGNIDGGVAAMQQAVDAKKAAGQKVPDEWYDYTVAKLYGAKRTDDVGKWLRMQLTDYPTSKNWRRSLLVYRDAAQLDNQGKLDLFRLMRSTKSLADQNDYLEYADIAYRVGLPFETKAVIEEGRAAGKVPAGALGTLLNDANIAIKNEGSLSALEAPARSAPNGTKAVQLADAYIGSGNYAKAVEFYRLGLEKGGVQADQVNLRLGTALANAGQRAEAKAAFSAVTTKPRAEIATFWNQWIDQGMTATTAPAA